MMKRSTREKSTAQAVAAVSDETLRGYVGYHMKRAYNEVQADLTLELKPLGLRILTYSALVLIADNPGLSQTQLAAAMDVERPNLVVVIDELEQRELIVRERVPEDRRAYALRVTLKGRQLYEKANAACQTHEDRILTNMPNETRDTVIAAMKLIQSSLSRG